ncbi:MAG: hypothetical protein RLW62_16710 [Gammaproteobacteria bacterium]
MVTRSRSLSLPRTPATVLALATLVFASGCASLPPPVAAVVDQHARAERVFLYQSRVADALLDRYPLLEVFEDADPALVAAEARMTKSCSALTRAVLAELEGEQPSLGLRFEVFTTLDDCERAARRIERLLDIGATEIAQTHSI